MEYIEVTGRTIDDALTNACLKLETTSDNIEYEVIEKGSNGLFGIFNSKPTKIKARVKAGVCSVDDEFSKLEAKEKKSIDDTIKSEIKAESKKEVVKETEKAVKKETAPKADNSKVSATQAVNASEEDLEEKANNNEPRPVLSNEEIESRIRTFLGDMFSAMDIPVEVKITFDTEEECVNVELIGENMGLLIGKRGQTLDSIQYLTSLVLNKGKEKYVRIKVDTENYRQRRKDTLESLAKNIAYKVKRSRRSVALEPMNPYERRIIHSALQGDKFVSTKSEGEEPFRHVVVYLDREKAGNNRYSEHRYSDNNRYSR
jgi:spoIIIJ-associated protein